MKAILDMGYGVSFLIDSKDAAMILKALGKAMSVEYNYSDSTYHIKPLTNPNVTVTLINEHSIKRPTELKEAVALARDKAACAALSKEVPF